MNYSHKKGFSLIELLVVIAIIGVLSTIVLLAVNNQRNKAKDTNIKAHLSQAKKVAELYYASNNYSYDRGAPNKLTEINPNDMSTLGTAIANLNSAMVVVSSDQAFCVSAVLIADSSHAWCVDSFGNSKSEPVTGCNGGTTCL